jgi:hypothetical protein
MMSGLPWRQGARVAVAALTAAVALTASGSAASTRAAGAQAPARSGPASSLASVDSMAAADAQPPIDDAGYEACANITATHPPGLAGPDPASAQVAGWADASKLGGSLPLGYPVAGLAQSEGGTGGLYQAGSLFGSNGQEYQCAEVLLQLDYDGQREFPPVTATFLAYGTIPVTATAYFIQDGPAPLKATDLQSIQTSTGVVDEGSTYVTVVTTSQVLLRVAAVKVNGVSLNVGGHCQTSGPVYTPDPVLDPGNNTLILSGGNAPGEPTPAEQGVLYGGAQAGLATIPPFTGCVTPSGENLDALLDSQVSGPGNYVSVDQGPLCSVFSHQNCPSPTVNQPLYPPLFAVSGGGTYSATGALTITERVPGTRTTISCAGTAASVDLPDFAGPPRGPAGTFQWPSALDCSGTGGSWTLTQEGTAFLDVNSYVPATQTTYGTADDITLDAQGPDGCTAQLTGAVSMTYTNDTGSLTLVIHAALGGNEVNVGGGAGLTVASSTCKQLVPVNSPDLSASYPLGTGLIITSPSQQPTRTRRRFHANATISR